MKKNFELIQIYPKEKVKIRNFHRFINNSEDENCYQLSELVEYMTENDITEMKVWLAEKDSFTNKHYFFCKAVGCFGEKGEGTCGKSCSEYFPRNGKSGICKNYKCNRAYNRTDICFILKIK